MRKSTSEVRGWRDFLAVFLVAFDDAERQAQGESRVGVAAGALDGIGGGGNLGIRLPFSLIELLVVVIIIAIIAAIAIPSLLASRRAANEGSAIASVRA